MSTPLPCPHGMPNAATCLDCMEDGPVTVLEPAPTWRAEGPPFVARYNSVCIGCDRADIRGGVDRVQRWLRGDHVAYLHEGCTP